MIPCAVGSLPTIYLGLPLGARHHSIAIWRPVIERFEAKLTRWKSKILSSGGRVTMIKLVLESLPVYFMLFEMPQGVKEELDKIQRRFLWSGSSDKRRIHWWIRTRFALQRKEVVLVLRISG